MYMCIYIYILYQIKLRDISWTVAEKKEKEIVREK